MRKKRLWLGVLGALVLGYATIPKPALLENFSYSSAVYDRNDTLLRLSLSRDDKYRLFTPIEKIPEEFKQALILYEDRHFYYHPGVDPIGLARSFINTAFFGQKQGASTITMQLARLAYNIDSTTIIGKLYQIIKALQIERHYSKDEILESYFNLSPYGGNVEGIGAASIVYFGTDVGRITLPEILTLTVIPQNPSKRNPASEKGFANAMEAQQRLAKIWQQHCPHDRSNGFLNLPISIRDKKELPFSAPHFTTRILQDFNGTIRSTLDINLQHKLEDIIDSYIKRNSNKGVGNASVLLLNYESMEIEALIGSHDFFNDGIQGQVNGTVAQRSPGSAMKPFIYALALEQGLIHPLTMLKDLPKSYASYNPENFDSKYQGLLTATSALVYSRNIPAVELLQRIRPHSLYELLQQGKVGNLKSEEFYGLALALGGFEISLQEMAGLYAMLANRGNYRNIKILKGYEVEADSKRLLSPEASFLALDMLSHNESTDRRKNTVPVYWKTGTSYSYKDAVSIGVFGPYVLAVWIGNFDGTPNPNFVGRSVAAPLFFEIVRALEKGLEQTDYQDSSGLNIAKVDICATTGDIANTHCPQRVKSWFIPGISPIKVSPIHREIPIDAATGKRACRHTPPITHLQVFEFWPSDIIAAYNAAGIYKKLPPEFGEDCAIGSYGRAPEIIYPTAGLTYMIRTHRLKQEKTVLKASADADVKEIYWFMDDALLGSSRPNEPLEIAAKIGTFTIKATDDLGRSSTRKLTVKLID